MKKIIYLFLTVLIVGCSGSSGGGSVSFVGNWQLNSITENGVDVHDSCDLESYMVLTNSNTGVYYQYYSDDQETEPCGLDASYNLTWSQIEGSSYLITFEDGSSSSYTAVLTNVLTLDVLEGYKLIFTKN
tara:strand:+ start:408 stop:797 length:390 start_codon:yes stop_codon:yes gene_type:complete